jgi:uncharacterized membrane protein
MDHTPLPSSDIQSHGEAKRLALIVYILQAASFLIGVTYIIGVVINYLKWPEVAGTWVESHFRWQANTFWYSVLWGIVGGLTMFLFVGYAVLFANAVWIVYRIAVGWIALNENRPIS